MALDTFFAGLIALALISADAHRRLRNLAVTDHLTGLPGTRAFHERLTGEVALAHRHERTLSLVMIDIDHFKDLNDGPRGHRDRLGRDQRVGTRRDTRRPGATRRHGPARDKRGRRDLLVAHGGSAGS
jgi:predicted signal transduction protein with EAL and GGDEF domain